MQAFGTLFGVISLVLALASYYPYYRDIFRGKTRPHIMTWFVWGLTTAIAFAGQVSGGAGAGAWPTGLMALASFGVTILAIRSGDKDITRSDWISFVAALCAIPLWLLTQDALLAVIWAALIDGLATFPTIRKSWLRPAEETLSSYVLSIFRTGFSIMALAQLNATTLVYPAVILLFDVIVSTILIGRRRALLVVAA